MASPPTPEPWTGELRSWGPVEERRQLRGERTVELASKRLGRPKDEVAELLLARPARHRYLLIEELGRTGHSTVFAAIDQLLAREVALKLHHYGVENDGPLRVLIEARTMSLVEHANVVRIIDFGEHEGALYSVTELCDGDLGAWAAGRPWTAILDRIIEAGRGLMALHGKGYVHGDVKPSNILIREGVAKVADFGLARERGLALRVGGTAGFVAPEVGEGMRTEAGDVFALAVTAWVCLFGELPFGRPPAGADRAAAFMVLIDRAREGAIVEPASSRGVPKRVAAVVRSGLDPDPESRPPLRWWLARLEAVRRRQERRRRLGLIAVASSALVMLGAGGHVVYEAVCAAVEPVSSIEEPAGSHADPQGERTAEDRMMRAADDDDPYTVWAVYWTEEPDVMFDAEQLVAVASRLLLDAESGRARNPAASAEIAGRLGGSALQLGWSDPGLVAQARAIQKRAGKLISHSK